MMSESKKIIVSGKELYNKEILEMSTTLSNYKFILITGTVYTPSKEVIPNAAIQVFKVNKDTKELVGTIFTVEDGSYGISVLARN